MLPQLDKFLKLLKDADVEFIVIGGVAMVAHGSAHVTFDLDICYRRTGENIERVALHSLRFTRSFAGLQADWICRSASTPQPYVSA